MAKYYYEQDVERGGVMGRGTEFGAAPASF